LWLWLQLRLRLRLRLLWLLWLRLRLLQRLSKRHARALVHVPQAAQLKDNRATASASEASWGHKCPRASRRLDEGHERHHTRNVRVDAC
jgi:hypothetical protein|tara:strand:+ start:1845 stop:2111 length:267 start_codon:yes stop_codon:yes gene_type:complete